MQLFLLTEWLQLIASTINWRLSWQRLWALIEMWQNHCHLKINWYLVVHLPPTAEHLHFQKLTYIPDYYLIVTYHSAFRFSSNLLTFLIITWLSSAHVPLNVDIFINLLTFLVLSSHCSLLSGPVLTQLYAANIHI